MTEYSPRAAVRPHHAAGRRPDCRAADSRYPAAMARVPLIEEAGHPELKALIAKIRAGRRGTLINVYRLLLHSPPLAEPWLDLVNAGRWKTALPGRLREAIIIRVGHLNGTEYVVRQHVPALALAE